MSTVEPNNSIITQIKYEKTSCYFCNDWLDSQTFKEHIIHCGQVLEKCPNSCSAYIQRKRIRSHLKECPKTKRESKLDKIDLDVIDLREYENRMLVLEQDIIALRSVLNEEIKQRLHLITDVGSLRKHNQISDEWTQKVGDVLSALKKCINQETTVRCNDLNKCNEDVVKLFNQYREMRDWRTGTAQNLCLEITNLQEQITKLSNEVHEICDFLTTNFFKIENNIKDNYNDIKRRINTFEESIETIEYDLKCRMVSTAEISSKQATLDCEVKGMKNIVCETEDKCEKIERLIINLDQMVHQMKQELNDLETHLLYQEKILPIHNTRGHLIWKINEYAFKLSEAKAHEISFQSPIFYNKQFGYTLRLDVHLNGIGTWRNRNIIACLTVVAGQFDPLLQWPCKLQADIILKDQPSDISLAEDYLKTTIVKRKNDDYHSNQYIHIPHKIVESRNYIRNDAIFFEVRVHRNKNSN